MLIAVVFATSRCGVNGRNVARDHDDDAVEEESDGS